MNEGEYVCRKKMEDKVSWLGEDFIRRFLSLEWKNYQGAQIHRVGRKAWSWCRVAS